MTDRRCPMRSAFALVLVLAALVLTVTAVVTITRASVTRSLAAGTAERSIVAADLIGEADRLITAWLSEHAGTVVLSADARDARIPVVAEALALPGHPVTIEICAIDQRGVLPWWLAGSSDPLAALIDGLAAPWLDRSVSETGRDRRGLALGQATRQREPDAPLVFPAALEQELSWHQLDEPRFGTDTEQFEGPNAETNEPAVLATISCFPSLVTGRGDDNELALNVSTAPIPLIESVLAAVDLSPLEQIRAARINGEQPVVDLTLQRGQYAPIRLVSRSDAWAFRVDIGVDRERRSWWLVYTASSGGWRQTQQWVIDE